MRTDRPDENAITEHLDRICQRGHDFPRVFSDFLALSCHSLTSTEPDYLELMGRYLDSREKDDRNADQFARAFGTWLLCMKTEMRDYLGEIFQQRVTRGEKGQYFTPEPLCKMMAQMTGATIKDGERVNDPACGSGRMLLATAEINPRVILTGADLDVNCVRMASLNLLCFNVDGVILHANSLSLEAHGGYQLSRSPYGGAIHVISKEEAQEILEAPLKHRAKQREGQMEMEL